MSICIGSGVRMAIQWHLLGYQAPGDLLVAQRLVGVLAGSLSLLVPLSLLDHSRYLGLEF